MLDLRMYLVTSGTGQKTVEVAAKAASAGAGVVQVRAKDLPTRELMELGREVARAIHRVNSKTRVIIDDRTDVAWALRQEGEAVHGVHLGAEDMPVQLARRLLGPEAVIGLTTGSLALVEAAQSVAEIVDYVGAGPFRPTPTKDSGREPLGVDGYPPLVAASSIPIVAIGDVQVDDVAALASTGIAGVAMVREVMHAKDPAAVVTRVLSDFNANCINSDNSPELI